MTLDDFMATTDRRLPSAVELVELCQVLDIRLALADAGPVLKINNSNRDVGMLIARLLKREPWRSQAIRVAKIEPEAKPDDREILWASGHVQRLWFPENGWPTGARAWRVIGETGWHRIPGVEWGPLPVPDGVTFVE